MSELAIRQTLEAELADWAKGKGLRVQFENQRFDDPPVDKPYLRATILWAPAAENDACDGELLSGVLQIDVFGQPLIGGEETGELVAELKELYPLDKILEAGVCKVMLRSPLRVAPAVPGASRYMVPTRSQFISYL
jgi:hypothetical protein